jgi:hypothetical protein
MRIQNQHFLGQQVPQHDVNSRTLVQLRIICLKTINKLLLLLLYASIDRYSIASFHGSSYYGCYCQAAAIPSRCVSTVLHKGDAVHTTVTIEQ